MRFKKIIVPIYGSRVVFVEGSDPVEIENKFGLDVGEYVYAHAFYDRIRENGKLYSCSFLIANRENIYARFTYGTLAHEVVHIAGFILDRAGVRADFNNDEPFAYLTEYIYNKAVAFYGALDTER